LELESKALLDIQCLMLPTYHFLYGIYDRPKLQLQHCQINRIWKLPHGSDHVGKNQAMVAIFQYI